MPEGAQKRSLTIKLVILPMFAWFVLQFAEQPADNLSISVLMAGMPTAVTAFVISEIYRLDTKFAALTMLTTTVVSTISISIIASLL